MARTESDWRRLSPAYRRRVQKGLGKKRWLAGESPAAATGHARTPRHGVEEALRRPERYGPYIGKHTEAISQRLRAEGEQPIGQGPRGREFTAEVYGEWGGQQYTLVIPPAPTSSGVPDGYRPGTIAFDSLRNAQDWARESGAPPGEVLIIDYGPLATGQGRYQVIFDENSPSSKRKRQGSSQRRKQQARRTAQRKAAERRGKATPPLEFGLLETLQDIVPDEEEWW